MFVFGVCVDSADRFDRFCLPAVAAHGGDDATLISSPDTPVARTYNEMLEATLDMEGVEAIVLLRDDVEITDPHFRAKVRAAFARDERLAVLGPGSSRPGPHLRWWQGGRRIAGPAGPDVPAPHTQDVDCVDGACLILRPDLAARFRFDDASFPGRAGFDVDFCFRVRQAGWTVGVEAIDITRHGDARGDASFHEAAAVWQGRRARTVGRTALGRMLARLEDTHTGPEAHGETGTGHTPPEGYYDFRRPRVVENVPPTASRVLVVGCGSGNLGAEITETTGARVTGIDYQEAALDIARSRIHRVLRVDLNNITDLPWPKGEFDAIVAADVLDRLTDPERTLQAVLPHLSPEGVVVATIPNVKHWSVLLPLLLQDRWEYRDAGLLHRGSVHFFTMIEAAAMFRRLGLGRFDVAGADEVPLSDADHLEPLVACAASYGADPDEVRTLLNAYEYIVTARRS